MSIELNKTKLRIPSPVMGEYALDVFTLKAPTPGPKVYIQAGMHGGELQGSLVAIKLLDYLKDNLQKGEVIIVPQANPYGRNQKMTDATVGRFDMVNGDNFNRMYWESDISTDTFLEENTFDNYEAAYLQFKHLLKERIHQKLSPTPWGNKFTHELAWNLQLLATDADIVLDFHTGPCATHYIYTPSYCAESALSFNFPSYLVFNNDFAGALDEASSCPVWDLANSWEKKTGEKVYPIKEAFTIEFQSQDRICGEEADRELENVLHYLASKELVPTPSIEKVEQHTGHIDDFKTLFAPKSGLVDYKVKPGDMVREGEVLVEIYCLEGYESSLEDCRFEVLAPCDCLIINHFGSGGVCEGGNLFQVLMK